MCTVLINDQGKKVRNTKEILAMQRNYYRNLYKTDPSIHFSIQNDSGIVVTQSQLDEMNCPLTIQELENALNGLAKNKTPGSDGLSVEFYCKFWCTLKEHFYTAVQSSFEEGKFYTSARRGIINSIPKAGKDLRKLKKSAANYSVEHGL